MEERRLETGAGGLLNPLRASLLIITVSLAAAAAAQGSGGHEPGRRVLLDAHNAYPDQGRWRDRVERALTTGAPLAIEQDLVWRPGVGSAPGQSIVSHGEPFTGDEPTLRDFFDRIRPIAVGALKSGSRDRWPLITLNLDFKDSHPQHLAAIWAVLGEYEEWLTTAKRTAAADRIEPLQIGPVLVLTGSDPAQQVVFHDRLASGSLLRLFGAVLPDRPVATNYRRWSNNAWSAVEPEGQTRSGEWTAEDRQRLDARVRAAHGAGLWIRFYTERPHV